MTTSESKNYKDMVQRNVELTVLREIVLKMGSVPAASDVYKAIVERALDIPGVSWAIVHQVDETEKYLNTPYYTKIHNKGIVRALKPIGIDLNKMLGNIQTGNKWRLEISKLKFAKDYIYRNAPGVVVFERFSEVMKGFWPQQLCDAIQKIGGHNKYVLVPILPAYEKPAAILFFITGNTSVDILEMIGAHCTQALNTVGYLKSIRQSQEKILETDQTLKTMNQELKAANRAKDEFLSLFSHELRTPLNSILGFSELLIDGIPGDINEEQRSCLGDILNSGQNLIGIINDILDISRIESGKLKVNLEPIDLKVTLVELVNSMKPQFNRKKQKVNISVPDEFPQVYADKMRITQVLTNLLTNANKYTMDSGLIDVDCSVDNNECCVCVSDTGIGIEKIYHDSVFNPTSNLKPPSDSSERSLGLGLCLSRNLVRLMHGRIWLESELGVGSKFFGSSLFHMGKSI